MQENASLQFQDIISWFHNIKRMYHYLPIIKLGLFLRWRFWLLLKQSCLQVLVYIWKADKRKLCFARAGGFIAVYKSVMTVLISKVLICCYFNIYSFRKPKVQNKQWWQNTWTLSFNVFEQSYSGKLHSASQTKEAVWAEGSPFSGQRHTVYIPCFS